MNKHEAAQRPRALGQKYREEKQEAERGCGLKPMPSLPNS